MTSTAKAHRRLATAQRRRHPRRRTIRRAVARLGGKAYSPIYEPSSPAARFLTKRKTRRTKTAKASK
jgi:hypothetical protein